MIRLFLFSRPLPKLTREQFQYSLLYDHAPLVRNCPGYVRPTSGYMQNHFAAQMVYGDDGVLLREPRFDNCSEFWYERIENILESYNNDDYFRMLRPDEDQRTDRATRVALIAEETVVFEDATFHRTPLMPKVVVLASRSDEMAAGSRRDSSGGIRIRCLRKTVNRVLGEFDFFNTKIAEGVMPEFSSITTYTLSPRLPDGSIPEQGQEFEVFDSDSGSSQFALWSRSHQIIGDCA